MKNRISRREFLRQSAVATLSSAASYKGITTAHCYQQAAYHRVYRLQILLQQLIVKVQSTFQNYQGKRFNHLNTMGMMDV